MDFGNRIISQRNAFSFPFLKKKEKLNIKSSRQLINITIIWIWYAHTKMSFHRFTRLLIPKYLPSLSTHWFFSLNFFFSFDSTFQRGNDTWKCGAIRTNDKIPPGSWSSTLYRIFSRFTCLPPINSARMHFTQVQHKLLSYTRIKPDKSLSNRGVEFFSMLSSRY